MSPFNNSKKWSAKSVLLWFFISLLLQFIVYYFAFIYGGSVKALGYISFAGTMVSIILAILAIGYTHVESNQQKNTSFVLANQIESLMELNKKLEVQADALEGIKGLEKKLNGLSENVDLQFKKTINKMDGFRDGVSRDDKAKDVLDISSSTLSELILENPSPFTCVCLITIILCCEKQVNGKARYLDLQNFINELDLINMNTSFSKILFGGCTELLLVLNRLQLIKKNGTDINEHVINYFIKFVDLNDSRLTKPFNGVGLELQDIARESDFYNQKK